MSVVRNENGEPFSKWRPADKFSHVLSDLHTSLFIECVAEYVFSPLRNWRLDFAWPQLQIGVEIDGFGYGHQAQQCMAEDNEKQNAAVELGWRVLRYNSRQLGSKQGVVDAVQQTCQIICDAKELEPQYERTDDVGDV